MKHKTIITSLIKPHISYKGRIYHIIYARLLQDCLSEAFRPYLYQSGGLSGQGFAQHNILLSHLLSPADIYYHIAQFNYFGIHINQRPTKQ